MNTPSQNTVFAAISAPGAPLVLLSSDECADCIGVSRRTLPIWRMRGRGPRFYKIGTHVRYRSDAVLEWLAERDCQNTIQSKAKSGA